MNKKATDSPTSTKKSRPLVEAIFEFRWTLLKAVPEAPLADPNYKILVGRLYDKLIKEYSFHEPLPAASIPEELLQGIVQHRFRKGKEQWPLAQIGPGVFTINDTVNFSWLDFKDRVLKGMQVFNEAYPNSREIKLKALILRFINAIEFDFTKNDAIEYLKKYMATSVELNPSLFKNTGVEKRPTSLNLGFSFNSKKPMGTINILITRGKKEEKDALVWNLMFISDAKALPELPSDLATWLENAYNIIKDWFYKLNKT